MITRSRAPYVSAPDPSCPVKSEEPAWGGRAVAGECSSFSPALLIGGPLAIGRYYRRKRHPQTVLHTAPMHFWRSLGLRSTLGSSTRCSRLITRRAGFGPRTCPKRHLA